MLACAKTIDRLYLTATGEKIINRLKKKDFILTCPNLSGADHQKEAAIIDLILSYSELSLIEKEELKKEILDENEIHQIVETVHPDLPFLTLQSSTDVLDQIMERIQTIKKYPHGKSLFEDMARCQNTLLIIHDKSSINAGGYASAIRTTTDIFRPGVGADARIRFRFDMPDYGTHLVTSVNNEMIPFTALDILFHEMVHAKHIMCGTFSRGDAERQAIEEENLFRAEREETKDWPARDWRAYEQDQQVWFGFD